MLAVLPALLLAACAATVSWEPAVPEPVEPAPPPAPAATAPAIELPPPARPPPGLAALRLDPVGEGGAILALDPAQRTHAIQTGFLVGAIRLRAEATDPGTGLMLEQPLLRQGKGSLAVTLPIIVGENQLTLQVDGPEGRSSYRLAVHRDGPDRLTPQGTLHASNPDPSDLFGYALAGDGDHLAIGAYLEASRAGMDGDQTDNSAEASGAVYLFRHEDGLWRQVAYLKGLPNHPGQQFGRALALSGDTLAVGAPFDALATGSSDAAISPAPASGAVHVFRNRNGRWQREAHLKAPLPRRGARFGASLALQGNRLAVGSPLEDLPEEHLTGAGAVDIFEYRDGAWRPLDRLRAPTPRQNASFGYRLALSGDALAVSAPLDPPAGAVHVYRREPDAPRHHHQASLRPRHARADTALFGHALAIDGRHLVIGAHLEDVRGENSGAVHIYRREGDAWTRQARLVPGDGAAAHRFGSSVALAGDILAAGAYLHGGGQGGIRIGPPDAGSAAPAESGAVYLYRNRAGTWEPIGRIKPDHPHEGEMFGHDLALMPPRLAVGAPMSAIAPSGEVEDAMVGAGTVYLFH